MKGLLIVLVRGVCTEMKQRTAESESFLNAKQSRHHRRTREKMTNTKVHICNF